MYMDSSSDGSTIGESTITSGTSTLPVNNKHLQIDRRTPSVSKFEHTIIYTPNRQYKRIDSSEQYRSYSAPKIYLEDNSNMANIDSIVKCHGNDDCDVDADHSRIRNTLKSYHHHHHHNRHHQQSHRPSDGNYSVRSSYEIELNKYRSCNNNNITDNRIPHSRYNTLSNSFSRRIDNNDALKLYSSVRCHSNPFRGGGDYDHQNTLDSYDSRMNNGLTASPRRPPLLRNLHNHLNLSPWTQEPSIFHSIDSHEKNSLSTRSLCPGIPSQKCVEQTAEIGLYKTAMFVIPSPNSTSLPNVQNIKNTLEETDYNRSLRHKRHRHVHSHSGGHRHHNSHSHHNHRECCDGDDDDAMISKSCNSKLRTYVCSGCGRKTTKRKKVKYLPSSSHSCISLDKCSTPHFISSAFNTSNINNNNNTNSNNNNNNNNTANSRLDIDDVYDSTVFHSSRQFTDDNRYYASPVRKSLSYNKREDIQPTADYISNHSNSNTSLDKIKSYDYLPKCSKSLNTISRADCNKIVVDIKPRQMNEADKQQHITQWIQIGTLGDATSSPTRLPLQTNEYHESDMTGLQQSENSDYDVSIVVDHSNEVNTGWRNSSIVHSRQQDNRHLTEKVVSQQKHSPIPPESPSPSPQPALPENNIYNKIIIRKT
uniref:Uncharacterized protein n=1 Tax=Trichobilharzia regenti TaxID=157069 RepID=A0AA85IZT6_TRIRE|nr:unnamed protein product [Trichobilharzia regenti]